MSDPRYEKIGEPDDKLIEESAELIEAICRLIQITCKAKRFGWDNFHPADSPERTNALRVCEEMDDVAKWSRELRARMVKLGLAKPKRIPHHGLRECPRCGGKTRKKRGVCASCRKDL